MTKNTNNSNLEQKHEKSTERNLYLDTQKNNLEKTMHKRKKPKKVIGEDAS